jgi:putative ABC transport system permease protein
MRISTIAFANLKRRRSRALFLAAGIAAGIGTVVALQSLTGSMRDEIGAQMDRFGANIIVLPRAGSLAMDYGGVAVPGVAYDVQELRDVDARRVYEIPYRARLSAVAPKLISAAQVEGRRMLLAGVDFAAERRLKPWWRVTGRMPSGPRQVLAGYKAARALELIGAEGAAPQHAGGHGAHGEPQRFRIMRERVRIGAEDYEVAGVLGQTGGPEDEMLFAALGEVQALTGRPGQLSLIEVSALCKDCPVEDIVAQIAGRLPHARVTAVEQAVRARVETVERLERFSAAVSAVVLAIGALMIFTTMSGSVVERTREIGVLRALGFRRRHIVQALLTEVAAVSAAGGLLGWLGGLLAGRAALPYFTETAVAAPFSPALGGASLAAALLLGLLASAWPALRASRLDPCEALRHV